MNDLHSLSLSENINLSIDDLTEIINSVHVIDKTCATSLFDVILRKVLSSDDPFINLRRLSTFIGNIKIHNIIESYTCSIICSVIQCDTMDTNTITLFHDVMGYVLQYCTSIKKNIIKSAVKSYENCNEPTRFLIELIVQYPQTVGIVFINEVVRSDTETEIGIPKRDILFSRIIELILLKYDTCGCDNIPFKKYNIMFTLFLKKPYVSYDCILFNIIEIIRSKSEYGLILIKILIDVCNKRTIECVANLFPALYSSSTITEISVFTQFLQLFKNIISRKSVIDLITAVISTLMMRYTTYYNPNNYSGLIKRKFIDDGSFPIKKLIIINKFFPELLKKFIIKYFTTYFCVYRLQNANVKYNDEFKKKLIKYTRQFNEWGYLPYSTLCNNFISKSNNTNDCPICLHETNMVFSDCMHSICEFCLITCLYTEEHMNTYLDVIKDLCITCRINNVIAD